MTTLEKEIFDTCTLITCRECPFYAKTKDFCAVGEPYKWKEEGGDKE